MKMTVEALKDLYVKLGGLLTDTYSDIANGIPVAEYTLTPDCILACSKKASGGGGGADLPEPGTAGNVLTSTGSAWQSAAPVSVTIDESITENGTNPVTGGAIYTALSGKQASLPAPSGNNGKVLGVDDGAYALLGDIKPTFEFAFSVTADGQGGYRITAEQGVTFAAIRAAMEKTPNVYAVIDFDGENRYLFSDIDTSVCRATGIYYGEISGEYYFIGVRIKVQSDNSCDIAVVPLAPASI